MSVTIDDLFSTPTMSGTELLEQHVDNGLIHVKSHPFDDDLMIANYSPECQFSRSWDDMTLASRGLIFYGSTGVVVARPFAKFFNLEEIKSDVRLSRTGFDIYDKHDGSLGIGYMMNGALRIATRGSFTSDQALWATNWITSGNGNDLNAAVRQFFHDAVQLGSTPLFEIVYPTNRIVRYYNGFAGLVPLGAINIANGSDCQSYKTFCEIITDQETELNSVGVFPDHVVVGPIRQNYQGKANTALKSLLHRYDDAEVAAGNVEGFVFVWPGDDGESSFRVKVKTDEYKSLHRIMTPLSMAGPRAELRVWESLSSGVNFLDAIAETPDEFYDDLRAMHDKVMADLDRVTQIIDRDFAQLEARYAGFTRREFAEAAKKTEFPQAMFALLDGKEIDYWKYCKPEVES